MTEEEAQHFADAWLATWNTHDLDAIMGHYAEDVEFTSPLIVRLLGEETGTVHGATALRAYFARGLDAYPELRFELVGALAGVRSVVLDYRSVNATRAAEVMELGPDGRVVRVQAHYRPDAG